MDNKYRSRNGYINRALRAESSDYAMFYTQLEGVLAIREAGNRFLKLYGLFHTTLQAYPEILKFFATDDFTIIRESGLHFSSDDVIYFRSFKKYPDARSLASALLGRLYMSRDIGFYSEKDQIRAHQFRTMLYPAHATFPERNWYGYPPPNTYNISEAVYFFERAIQGGATYFRNQLTLYAAIKSGLVTNTYITSFIIACMKLEFLNVLPCNTVEYVASKKSMTFSDIIEDLLNSLDTFQPGMSKGIYIGGIPVRVALRQAGTRRQLQNFNIQNISLNRESDDTVRLSRGVATEIAMISERSQGLSTQI